MDVFGQKKLNIMKHYHNVQLLFTLFNIYKKSRFEVIICIMILDEWTNLHLFKNKYFVTLFLLSFLTNLI